MVRLDPALQERLRPHLELQRIEEVQVQVHERTNRTEVRRLDAATAATEVQHRVEAATIAVPVAEVALQEVAEA